MAILRNIILLLLLSSQVMATKWYLSPSGNDVSGTGTISSPFFTLNRVKTYVSAGDTIYLRGGTYEWTTGQVFNNKSGTAGNYIKIWAYPAESPKITPAAGFTDTRGIWIYNCAYVHVKGLEITGFICRGTSYYYGITVECSANMILEQLSVHHNGFGLSIGDATCVKSYGNIYVTNCDFYANSDSCSASPWGGADGLTIRISTDTSYRAYISGCRSWNNSDDGFDGFNGDGLMYFDNNWFFRNGTKPDRSDSAGDGNGLKLGPTFTAQSGKVRRVVRNNLLFHNHVRGIDQNNLNAIVLCYNNTVYGTIRGRGYNFDYGATLQHVVYNNIDYKSKLSTYFVSPLADVEYNSWQVATVTDDDFFSIDTTGVTGARQADGSLPALNFLRLKEGSDLIDAGTDVGLDYIGDAPDIGALEYVPVPPARLKIVRYVGRAVKYNGKVVKY